MPDCDRFWLLMSLGHVKSVNSHRDDAGTPKTPKTKKKRETKTKEIGKNKPGSYTCIYGGFPKSGLPFLGLHKKDYSILGVILGSHNLGKLPYV